jgi:hypothetical protein
MVGISSETDERRQFPSRQTRRFKQSERIQDMEEALKAGVGRMLTTLCH